MWNTLDDTKTLVGCLINEMSPTFGVERCHFRRADQLIFHHFKTYRTDILFLNSPGCRKVADAQLLHIRL